MVTQDLSIIDWNAVSAIVSFVMVICTSISLWQSKKQLKEIRLLFKMNFSHIELIEAFEVDQRVLSIIMDYFYYHSGIILKSWEILKEI